jgi:hypothetical protein
MSEYELSLLGQRGLAAPLQSAAWGAEVRVTTRLLLELGQMEVDPDERVCEAVRMVLRKFQEWGSARQVLLWTVQAELRLPVTGREAARYEASLAARRYELVNPAQRLPWPTAPR